MNEHRRREADRARMLDAIASGRSKPLDRMGIPIAEGDRVVYRAMVDPVYIVDRVTPIVDPGAPPGYVRVSLSTYVDVPVAVGNPVQNMIIVARAQARPDSAPGPGSPADSPAESAAPSGPGPSCTVHGGPLADSTVQSPTVPDPGATDGTVPDRDGHGRPGLSEGVPPGSPADPASGQAADFSNRSGDSGDLSSVLPFRGKVSLDPAE